MMKLKYTYGNDWKVAWYFACKKSVDKIYYS